MHKKEDEKPTPTWLIKYAEECFPTPEVNFGGAVKRTQALRLCVLEVWLLQKGSIDDLILKLQKLLGLTQRKVREDYVYDLVKFGIISKIGNGSWQYIGQSEDSEESFMEYVKQKKQKKEA